MITLPIPLLERIRRHAERDYPEECCGALLGKETAGVRHITAILEIENSQDANRRRRFFIGPEAYRAAEEDADRKGLQLLGFYHSHPDHPAAPSQFDTDHAFPWLTYAIVSVMQGWARDTTAWILEEGSRTFVQHSLEIEDERSTAVRTHGPRSKTTNVEVRTP